MRKKLCHLVIIIETFFSSVNKSDQHNIDTYKHEKRPDNVRFSIPFQYIKPYVKQLKKKQKNCSMMYFHFRFYSQHTKKIVRIFQAILTSTKIEKERKEKQLKNKNRSSIQVNKTPLVNGIRCFAVACV